MPSWARHRWIAFAAHLALWLAIVSPVISQTLARPSLPLACGPHAVLGQLGPDPGMAGMPMGTPPDGHHPDGDQAPGDVCGYCSLFAHFPWALALATAMATLPPLPIPARTMPSRRPMVWRADYAFDAQGPPRFPL